MRPTALKVVLLFLPRAIVREFILITAALLLQD